MICLNFQADQSVVIYLHRHLIKLFFLSGTQESSIPTVETTAELQNLRNNWTSCLLIWHDLIRKSKRKKKKRNRCQFEIKRKLAEINVVSRDSRMAKSFCCVKNARQTIKKKKKSSNATIRMVKILILRFLNSGSTFCRRKRKKLRF